MKYIIIIFSVIFFSCTSRSEDKPVTEKARVEKPAPKMEETFPFSEADKIEVVSYPVRYSWDTIRNSKREYLGSLVQNKKLVNPSEIKERIFLNDLFRRKLFNSLFIRKNKECEVAACFDPRHAILFYNDKSEIIANIEICFDCGGSEATFEHNELCYEGLKPIGDLFKEAGIEYFGEGK